MGGVLKLFTLIGMTLLTLAGCVNVGQPGEGSYTVSLTLTGLSGTVILQNNLADDLTASSDGIYTFQTNVEDQANYSVTIKTQPSRQTCTIGRGSGIINSANVADVTATCASDTYSIGGTVTGVVGTLVLQNNRGDDLSITANGTFTFVTSVADKSAYDVTVKTQPALRTCSVAGGAGSVNGADISGVTVTCAKNSYAVGGTISGLNGTVVLQNNAGDDLSVTASGNFTFATKVADSATYAVTVKTNPNRQTCTVANGSGTIDAAAVTNVTVTCTTDTYSVGGTVSGLSGTVVLQNNAGNNLSVTSNGSFTFTTKLSEGAAYAVTIGTQPSIQVCTLATNAGTIGTANITNVTVTCTTTTYTVGGTVSNLTGTVVLQNNGGDNLSLSSNGAFTFATAIADASTYVVTVLTQPNSRTCAVTTGSGTLASANITTVAVTCYTDITVFKYPTAGAGVDGDFGGRATVDALCDANKGVLTCANGVHALLTTTSSDTMAGMPTTYTFPTTLAMESSGNTQIASSWSNFLAGTITNSMTTAGVLDASTTWWTGSNLDGTIDSTCTNWSSNAAAAAGSIQYSDRTSTFFLSDGPIPCNSTSYILCLCY